MPEAVTSPCINVCKMEAGLCAGCFRTIDEIAGWANAGDDEKRLILAAVAQRRSKLDPDVDLACNCAD
ncbi:MAG: DUF1289 domain-containing protein [Rhodocyclales bacterium]|nr:DUF1289 domain-containing protein [Rhodocyclales bacterium]